MNEKGAMERLGESRMRAPFFSVVIAVYNGEKLIGRALDSLIAQTEMDWEAIVVDDGSTDRTYGTLFPYMITFPHIKYFRQRHSGSASSKNRGIRESAGKYVTFLDSDDEYSPGHLACRKSLLLNDPSIAFLHGGARILGNQYVPDRNNISRRINLRRCVIGGTFIIDSRVARELNGFDTGNFGADADFYDRIRSSGYKMRKVADTTYIYHHENEDSVTNRMLARL